MKITQIQIKGFRNFKDAVVNFEEKTLIIGANDVGKTNLLYGLRVLLDRTLSEQDIEPQDSDFYAYEETNEFSIVVKFENVSENIEARFKGAVSDDKEMFLAFVAKRDSDTRQKEYEFLSGKDIDSLEARAGRDYLKTLNIRYISSYRDLFSFIKREKNLLMNEAKEARTEEEENSDKSKITEVDTKIKEINKTISEIEYIQKATSGLNVELKELSFHHTSQEVVFSIGGYDVQNFIDNAQLSSQVNGNTLNLGGDGRNNQIFMALWAAKNKLDKDPALTTIFAVEEPEAHLHPHQQRKLAEYLSTKINSQVLITTHSPQILSMFSPNSIVRLYLQHSETKIASNGCSKVIDEALSDFGFRMSVLPAEAFFANVVFLVEGPSEVTFYSTLGRKLFDLDRYNVSILGVGGIDFLPFVKVLRALEIPFVIRTDNDIFKIPKSDPPKYRLAGIQRAIGVSDLTEELKTLVDTKGDLLSNFDSEVPPQQSLSAAKEFVTELEKQNIFISVTDLENDLVDTELFQNLSDYYAGETDKAEIVKLMQKSKGTFMFNFLLSAATDILKVENNPIASPLKVCKSLSEAIFSKL